MQIKIFLLFLIALHCDAQKTISIPSIRRVFGTPASPGVGIRLPVITTLSTSSGNDYGNYPLSTNQLPSGAGILTAGGSRYLAIPAGAAGREAYPPVINEDVLARLGTLGLSTPLTGGIPLGASHSVGPVIAAIITQRTAEVVDIPTPPEVIHPQVLIVEPNQLPVTIEFRSQSSPVNVNQVHIPGAPGEVKSTRSEEEPDRVLHEVVKPVIQEVREIIQPFRKITQEILPVQEEVHSVVARGEGIRQQVIEPAIPPPQAIAPPGVVTATVLENRPSAAAVAIAAGPVFAAAPAQVVAPVAVVAEPVATLAAAPVAVEQVVSAPVIQTVEEQIPLTQVRRTVQIEPIVNNLQSHGPITIGDSSTVSEQRLVPELIGSVVQSGTFGTRVVPNRGGSNLAYGPRRHIIKRKRSHPEKKDTERTSAEDEKKSRR